MNKTWDSATESSFMEGVRYGRTGEKRAYDAYRAWRGRWAGLSHEGPGDTTAAPLHGALTTPSADDGCTELGCLNHG